ncbi:MAG TPA: thiamine phosphate synthase [Spirochaetota bacterium]|nr:MAG: Thiamine-phosphate synthase [Spirochaetes bacterium ADurb.BinA120]HNU92472.1 thiamine phosphate synthase [Spirochaetota bacterium]HPI13173.1 thiamine phosphate synthase [Spirochaetota bacterium]HPV98703.1 thiamine phosphate synthase [Spirochaetota bacterium]
MRGYYFITDSGLSLSGNLFDVRSAVAAGVRVVQYRNKSNITREMYEEALSLKRVCEGKANFIINDRLDVALAVGADGVHIGLEDMPYGEARRLLGPDKIIGVTVHDLEESLEAEAMGADYIGLSPIFATGTKGDAGAPCGTGLIAEVKKRCRVPLVAIGGIDLSNVDEVIAAGADMVCAISAVVTKQDVAAAILKFQGRYGL